MKDYKRLGDYIREVNVRNRGLEVTDLLGLSMSKQFRPSTSNIVGVDLSKYKVVNKKVFAFDPMSVIRVHKVPIAMNDTNSPIIVSPAYITFECIDTEKLDPHYLMMWFQREEFDRFADFKSDAAVRGGYDWTELCDTMVYIPSITRQREIVAEYETLTRRIHLNEQMIQHFESTAQALYRKMFVDGIDKENLPEGWRMGTVGELAEVIIAGVIPNYTENSEFKVLGQRCVHDHRIDMNFAKTHMPKFNCPYVKNGDILINSTGSGTLGRAGQIFDAPSNLAFDSNMTLVRPKFDHVIDYLGLVIFEKENYFVQISQGSTNQTRLYCSMVKPIEIIIPSEHMLKKFRNCVHSIRNDVEYRKSENSKLTELQSLLLAKMGQ